MNNTVFPHIRPAGIIFFVGPSTAGIIRMRVLFEGVDYSKKLSTLKVKKALMSLYDAILGVFHDDWRLTSIDFYPFWMTEVIRLNNLPFQWVGW